MIRLAFFDLDNTLVDRRAALSDALTALCRSRGLSPEADQWLRTELTDRATVEDFARLRDTFSLDVPAGQLWQEALNKLLATWESRLQSCRLCQCMTGRQSRSSVMRSICKMSSRIPGAAETVAAEAMV